MNDKNYLVYFLNSMKDELGFEDSEDFKNKVESNLAFKIKIQKFVGSVRFGTDFSNILSKFSYFNLLLQLKFHFERILYFLKKSFTI